MKAVLTVGLLFLNHVRSCTYVDVDGSCLVNLASFQYVLVIHLSAHYVQIDGVTSIYFIAIQTRYSYEFGLCLSGTHCLYAANIVLCLRKK